MIKLLKGDCLELMKTIENGSVDAIITDPPYGTTACKWDSVIPFDLMWEQLNRIIKPNGAIVLTAQQPFTSNLIMSNTKNFRYNWVWDKGYSTGFANANKMPMKGFEDVCVFYKKLPTYNPQGLVKIEPKIIEPSPTLVPEPAKNKKERRQRGKKKKKSITICSTCGAILSSACKFCNKCGMAVK